MTDLKSVYSSILESNGVHNEKLSTKAIREKITRYIDDVQFTKAKRCNEPDRVCLSCVCDGAVDDTLSKTSEDDMQQLFDSASILRDALAAQTKNPWKFEGNLNTDDA